MNHINLEDAWSMFDKYKQELNYSPNGNEHHAINQTQNSNKIHRYNDDPLDDMFTFVWTNHQSIVTSQEDYKVGKFVKDIYFAMFPHNAGETYPASWILPAMETYKKIRELRAKKLKSKPKDAMKGLKMHLVVGCILRCQLISDNVHIPLPILITFMNLALQQSRNKRDRSVIKIEAFETYRTDSKKGIKTFLKTLVPKCYNDLNPDELIDFTAYGILRFSKQDVLKAKRIARNVWNDGNGDFADTTSPSIIAIGALFTVSVIIKKDINYKLFGLSKIKLSEAYKTIINSENTKVQNDLDINMSSPSKLISPKSSVKLK